MFRKMATKTKRAAVEGQQSQEQFTLLDPAQKVAIRQKLLECLQGETLPHVRHKVGDAIAEVARQYADNSASIMPKD